MARTNRREWAKRIREWKRSGLSGTEFAAKLGVKEGTLRHWCWQLSYMARTGQAPIKRKPGAKFVEVLAPVPEPEPEPFELILGNGIRVRVPARFDAGDLRRVIESVEPR